MGCSLPAASGQGYTLMCCVHMASDSTEGDCCRAGGTHAWAAGHGAARGCGRRRQHLHALCHPRPPKVGPPAAGADTAHIAVCALGA